MNALQRIGIVFHKEFIDNLRDRRSLSSSLLNSLFTPAIIIVLIIVLGSTIMREAVEKPLDLPVQGAEYAPGLMAYLRQRNVNILPAPEDPEAAVREGEAAVVLVIPPEYGEELTAGRPAPMRLVMDSSRTSASTAIQRARGLVNGYSQTLAVLRMQVRGVSPSALTPIDLQPTDLATPQSSSMIFLNMLPFVLIMTIFMGGMYVIIDATAGERERGSLEPLLINPIPRREFVLGKLLASLPYALAALALALGVLYLGFNVLPLEEFTGMQMNIHPAALANMFLLSLPVVLLASGLQMVLAAFTRSFKEAQTYLPFLPLVAGLPTMFLAFIPVKIGLAVSAIPVFGQALIINQLLRGETVQPENVIASVVGTLVVAVVVILLSIRLYEREKILFGGR